MIDISSQTPRSNPPTRDSLQGRMLYELIPYAGVAVAAVDRAVLHAELPVFAGTFGAF